MCYSVGSVEGGRYVGGLMGLADFPFYYEDSIATSYSAGEVRGDYAVGGLVGINRRTVTRCYSTCSVTGRDTIGGLVGYAYDSVRESYSSGPVAGDENVGGLVGQMGYTPRRGSYGTPSFWDIDTSSQASSVWGVGKTTGEMQTGGTFLDAGWDFVGEAENGTEEIWWIDGGHDYPRLWWEREEGEPEGVIELNAADFDSQIAEGVVLVDFHTTWCSFCTMQAPILDEVAERLGGQARVAKLDVDEARDIMQRYNITGVPTLIVFRDGQAVERFVGLTDADTLVTAVLSAIESDR
jgi:thioredoxin